MPALSLYIHIPYCQAKCPYCDFNSYAAQHWPEARYAAALCAELQQYAEHRPWRGGTLRTVFFGGGTPSLFAAESIAIIIGRTRALWPTESALDAPLEITLEANPGTVTLEKLRAFRAAGVSRMSFGVQSFQPHHLRTLGRIHNAEEAVAAVDMARQVGFTNVSIDLIFALPRQTVAEWERDLVHACALNPDHISVYNLTYEEGTLFHKLRSQNVLRPLPEEIDIAMFTRTQEILSAGGYDHYEISNYARSGYMCRHNLNYWHGGNYLGVGAGAHSYARPPGERYGSRWSNEKTPLAYIESVERQGHARTFTETLDARQARGEFVFLGLRCLQGFAGAAFQERFGIELTTGFPHVNDLCEGGLLQCRGGRWMLTPQGLLLADSVFATFL